MRIAISGAGVAGPTLAYWLLQGGHEPTLIEVSPTLRAGGYMIDFWGVGYSVAERMDVLPKVHGAGYQLREVFYVDGRGRRSARISAATITRELGDRFTSLPRGELASILYQSLEGRVETLLGVAVESFEPVDDRVQVVLSDGSRRDFELLVGADGLHSRVRTLAFGPEVQFERPIGYYVAAFEADGYRPRDELAYVSRGLPGRQISRFALRGGKTMFLLVFTADRLGWPEPIGIAERKLALAQVFAGADWEWPAISAALAGADEVYFDRVSQVRVPAWSNERVALVGDAAACVSLLAGEGTGLAMTEAYVLAGELSLGDAPEAALARYEARLRSFIDGKQKAARAFAGAFAPRTTLGLLTRNAVVNLMALPGLPDLMAGPQMRDNFSLPDYDF